MSSLRYRWPMFPQTINAMYQFYENEIGKVNWTVIMKCSNFSGYISDSTEENGKRAQKESNIIKTFI